ncbi:MAG: ADP-forming succinate--CoA ligase subunit beta [Holophaga sp.]|jgi:succinyl-CoA synthetase beta subunit
MDIHEYQAKELLRQFGIATPDGRVARDAAEAIDITREFGGQSVVKAQIHAGGRGKGGGVKFARTPEQAADLFKQIHGMTLVTKQTGAEGRKVRTVYIAQPVDIARELYLSLLVDRGSGKVAFLASSEGGVEIEEVAARSPEKIVKALVHPGLGLAGYQVRELAAALGLRGESLKQAGPFLRNLYRLFVDKDCSMVEINPLVVTAQGDLTALDAKIGFDDNALFRHPEIQAYRDLTEEAPTETEASSYGLNFIKLDGEIGCMVNGAGLAMATMDIIKLHGRTPANFLDVGGGASEEAVKNAFRIILQDPGVKAVLVNIFGGIMRCDVVARGIVNASREIGVKVPVVVRLEGTNVEEGKRTLQESGLAILVGADLGDAARKVVAAVA